MQILNGGVQVLYLFILPTQHAALFCISPHWCYIEVFSTERYIIYKVYYNYKGINDIHKNFTNLIAYCIIFSVLNTLYQGVVTV
jgi:hypothetical protein